jgi:hypothetical protein
MASTCMYVYHTSYSDNQYEICIDTLPIVTFIAITILFTIPLRTSSSIATYMDPILI